VVKIKSKNHKGSQSATQSSTKEKQSKKNTFDTASTILPHATRPQF